MTSLAIRQPSITKSTTGFEAKRQTEPKALHQGIKMSSPSSFTSKLEIDSARSTHSDQHHGNRRLLTQTKEFAILKKRLMQRILRTNLSHLHSSSRWSHYGSANFQRSNLDESEAKQKPPQTEEPQGILPSHKKNKHNRYSHPGFKTRISISARSTHSDQQHGNTQLLI